MPRNETESHRNTRRNADDEDALQKPEEVPSFLTARELQARDPARIDDRDREAGERHASASFEGSDGEPPISDEDPPRGERGLPPGRSDPAKRKGSPRKSK